MAFNRLNKDRRLFVSTLLLGGLTAISGELFAAPRQVYRQPATTGKVSSDNVIADSAIKDAVRKAQDFEHNYHDDIYISKKQSRLLNQVLQRMTRLQRTVGYGNFNLIDFDRARRYARHYSVIGSFSRQETGLIEELFEFDASNYGFFGRKVSNTLTERIKSRDVKKIRGSGHYLYQGDALTLYNRIKRQMGDDLVLTSGIRSVVKQLYLFIAKVEKSGGNLSRAARSLAPPGHSFHGVGDFDVGQRGLGAANFTNAFAQTHTYKRLTELGYISMRYPLANPYGVRYEPWHIKVVDHA